MPPSSDRRPGGGRTGGDAPAPARGVQSESVRGAQSDTAPGAKSDAARGAQSDTARGGQSDAAHEAQNDAAHEAQNERALSRRRRAEEDRKPVPRFDRVQRTAHHVNATLIFILGFTGLALYYEPLTALIGRRHLIQSIHVYCGIALPIPIVVSALGYWGRGMRLDLSRLNRWIPDDGTWLRATFSERQRRARVRNQLRLGKFNAGQKLNAAFVGGAIVVMLMTGLILQWYHPFPLAWRTGATFVHDWLAVALFVVVLGHIRFALGDEEALSAMWKNGRVTRGWARRNAPAWLAELDALAKSHSATPSRSSGEKVELGRHESLGDTPVGAARAGGGDVGGTGDTDDA